MSFRLTIITPVEKVFEDTVEGVLAPGEQGWLEVLSNHEAMLVALKEGKLRVTQSGVKKFFSCGSGILEVNPNHDVLVLVEGAVLS